MPAEKTVSGRKPSAAGGARPNILVLIADDLGDRDLGCYGHPTLRTPHLDRLAAEGIRFSSAFVTTSSCSPSRSSFFTGRYPHATGAEDLHVPLPPEQKIIPAYLRELGYFSANVGKLHLGEDGAAQFDRVEEDVEAWRTVLDQRPAGKPFFLAVGYHEPHRPYEAGIIPDPTDPKDVIVPPFLADTPETRADLALYYDYAVRMDRRVGELLDYLDSHKLTDNTLVLFWSDNGMPFPRAKITNYDSGIRTPMLVRWPGRTPRGRVCHALVSTVDFAPSLVALAGGKPAPAFQGLDLSRVFVDPAAAGRTYIHAECNWHDMDDHVRSVRDCRYKYIRNCYPREAAPIALDLLTSPSYASLRALREKGGLTPEQMRHFMIPRAAEELYDTREDQFEFVNLAADPAYVAVLARLAAECDRWVATTEDVPPSKRRVDLMDVYTGKITGQFGAAPLRPVEK